MATATFTHVRSCLNLFKLLATLLLAVVSMNSAWADGKLKATGGVSSIDGSGGGGLIPWATLSSYAEENETGATGFVTRAAVSDFTLDAIGVAGNYHDRMEVSLVRHSFTINANDEQIRQDKVGVKFKLAGDLIYGDVPQISAGVLYSHLRDPAIARAVGARDTQGTEFYVSAARVWLNTLVNRTALFNVNARYSTANQYGLLGFGGDDQDGRWHLEIAAALFITRNLAIGAEYRQKPDNLVALTEQSASDIFIAWFPNKRVSVTAAWLDLGEIAGASRQTGAYLSIQGVL